MKKRFSMALLGVALIGLLSGCQKLSDLRAYILGALDSAKTKVEEVKTQINETKDSIEKKVEEIKNAATEVQKAGTQVKEAVGAINKVTE